MKKLITLSSVAATLLVGTPVGAAHAETINKDNTSYNVQSNLNNFLYSYFKLPSLNATNQVKVMPMTSFADLNKIFQGQVTGLDTKQIEELIKQAMANTGVKPANPGTGTTTPVAPVKPTTPVAPVKPTTPVAPVKPTTPSTPVKPTTPSTPVKPTTPSTPASTTMSAYEQKVFDLTNAERAKAGLKPFAASDALTKTARLKSQDMTDKHYFDHNSPTYGSPFDMMKQFGITYNYAAENIAQGQRTPEEVVTAWMNSAGHRANILNPNLNQLGVGYDSRSNTWTQQFIGK